MWSVRLPASIRATRALTGAALLIALSAVPVSAGLEEIPIPPDVVTGVTGPVAFSDHADLAGVACQYRNDIFPTLVGVAATPPGITWPDRDPAKAGEHGRVRWRVIVQVAPSTSDTGWTVLKRSTIRTGSAGEAADAELTPVALTIAPARGTWIRVVHKVTWLRKDGRVLGTLRHIQVWQDWTYDGQWQDTLPWHCPDQLRKA